MEYDKIEIRNYLIKRLCDAKAAIMDVQRAVDTITNRKAQSPNIFTRFDLATEAIEDIRNELKD